MKELSIEQKAKAYDEAIRKAKITLDCCDSASIAIKNTIYDIFPELAESEDEKIRKALINKIKCLDEEEAKEGYSFYADDYTADDCIAWLEKQGESIKIKKGKTYLCTKTHKYAGEEWIEGIKYYSPEDYSLVNQGCTYHCPEYSKEEHNNFFNEEEYAEIKPKFKVGDWIVNKGHSYLIAYIDYEQRRYLFEIGGYTHEQLNWEYIENADNKYHLWTNADASDGDVLASNSSVFIFSRRVHCRKTNSILWYIEWTFH